MERLRLRGLELFYRSRQYAGNYLIGTGVAVLVALCVACPIYDAVAQTSDATDDGTLTVEECLGKTNASIDPIAEDLMKQGIIAVDLLPTMSLTRFHGPIRVELSGFVKGVEVGQERQALLA